MLVRVIGPNSAAAGLVFGTDTGLVRVTAPILRWAMGMNEEQLRVALRRKGLKASYVRTLTRAEIQADGWGPQKNNQTASAHGAVVQYRNRNDRARNS